MDMCSTGVQCIDKKRTTGTREGTHRRKYLGHSFTGTTKPGTKALRTKNTHLLHRSKFMLSSLPLNRASHGHSNPWYL